jgi:hypothetical protein
MWRRFAREPASGDGRNSVSERRARLQGLDEPVVTKSEVAGKFSVKEKAKFVAERELGWLDVAELEGWREDSTGSSPTRSRKLGTPVAIPVLPAVSMNNVDHDKGMRVRHQARLVDRGGTRRSKISAIRTRSSASGWTVHAS